MTNSTYYFKARRRITTLANTALFEVYKLCSMFTTNELDFANLLTTKNAGGFWFYYRKLGIV